MPLWELPHTKFVDLSLQFSVRSHAREPEPRWEERVAPTVPCCRLDMTSFCSVKHDMWVRVPRGIIYLMLFCNTEFYPNLISKFFVQWNLYIIKLKINKTQKALYAVRKQIRGVIDEIMSFLPTPLSHPQTKTSCHLRLRRHLIGLPPILHSINYGRSFGWFPNSNTVSKQISSKSNTSWCFIVGRGEGVVPWT